MYISTLTYSSLLCGVKLVAPGLHAMGRVRITRYKLYDRREYRGEQGLHKGVVDRDDKDLSGLLELGVVDV